MKPALLAGAEELHVEKTMSQFAVGHQESYTRSFPVVSPHSLSINMSVSVVMYSVSHLQIKKE